MSEGALRAPRWVQVRAWLKLILVKFYVTQSHLGNAEPARLVVASALLNATATAAVTVPPAGIQL